MIDALRKIPIFAGLDEPALQLLSEAGRETTVPAQTLVVKEGESGNRFFLVLEGEVIVWKRYDEPDTFKLARLKAGDFFGDMCILETLPRVATVQAVAETRLFSISSMTFLKLYDAMPAQYGLLLLNLARDLSRRLRRLDEAFAARH